MSTSPLPSLLLFASSILFTISSTLTKFQLHSSPTPPHPGAWWFVHYNANKTSIWMLNPLSYNGSLWQQTQYLQSYHISSNTWSQHTFATNSFYTWSQSYTSIGSTLYFVTDQSTFGTFNSDTQELLHPHPTIALSQPQVTDPCMTTDGRYIFIIGGQNTLQTVPYFKLYDTMDDQWMNGTSLNTARKAHACQYNDGYVYVFGGTSIITTQKHTNSIEMIAVGFDDVFSNILSQTWSLLSSTLEHACAHPTSAICSEINTDLIYIFGGSNSVDTASASWLFYDFIQVFNTTNKMIYDTGVTLNISRAGASAFCMNNYIYVMLGVADDGSMLYNWEKSNALDAVYQEDENSVDRATGIFIALSFIVGTIVLVGGMCLCSKTVIICEERAKVKRARDIDFLRMGSQEKDKVIKDKNEVIKDKNKVIKKEIAKDAKPETDAVETDAVETDAVARETNEDQRKHTLPFRRRVASVEYVEGHKDDSKSASEDAEGDEGDYSDAESDTTDSEDLYNNENNLERQVTVGGDNATAGQ